MFYSAWSDSGMAFAHLAENSFAKDQLAIAVSHSHMGAGHIGLAFHSAKSGPQLLHLAWHRKLEVDAVPLGLKTCWAFAALGTPPAATKQLIAFVRTVATRGAQINYAIDFIASRGSFALNGSYKPPKGSHGLTCASFVLEVLRGGLVNLLDESTWVADEANIAWGREVCDSLEKSQVDNDHLTAVRRSVSGLRLRPFEVAGAGELGSKAWPVTYQAVQQPANGVEAELLPICPVATATVNKLGPAPK